MSKADDSPGNADNGAPGHGAPGLRVPATPRSLFSGEPAGRSGLGAAGEANQVEYREMSVLAIVGLVLGLLAPLALANSLLWVVPLVGAVVSAAALATIDRSAGALAGRRAALAGLALSVLFGAAGPTQFLYTERLFARRAEQVALEWFAALQRGEPIIAQQISSPSNLRVRTADVSQIWHHYRGHPDRRKELERFVGDRLVRTLLALDGKAQARLYQTQSVNLDGQRSVVNQLYAVTYEDDGGARKSFFVNMGLERSPAPTDGKVEWRVVSYSGGVDPG